MNTPHIKRVPFLALITTLLITTAASAAGIQEKQIDSTFTGDLIRKDGSVTYTGNQPMGGFKLTGVGDGTDPGDVVTKSQLDAASAGLDPKESVRLCSDGILDDNTDITGTPVYDDTGGTSTRGEITGTLAVSGTLTLDDIAVVDGDRIMLHNEGEGGGLGADANGVWLVSITGTALSLERTVDFDEDAEVTAGAYFFIEEGTVCGGKGYVLTTPDPITIGGVSGTSLTFSVFSSIAFGTTGVTSVDAGDSASVGTGAAARVDHQHAVSTGTPGGVTLDAAAAEGSATSLARSDHEHGLAAATAGSIQPDDAAAEGSASSVARSDHKHSIASGVPGASVDAGDAAAEGSSTGFARDDHQHAVNTAAPSAAQTPDQANAEGSATTLARSDHTHNIPAGTAANVGTANAEGSASDFARSDHAHDSPAMTDANKREASAVTTGTNQTTGLTIASTPALDTQPMVDVNGILYSVGDGTDVADFYYSGDACTTPRATAAIASSDVLCQGDDLPFNLAATDLISQHYLSFTNN